MSEIQASASPASVARASAVPRPDAVTLSMFVLCIFISGGNAVAVRFTVAELPPFWGAFLRLFSAAAIFWLMVLLMRPALPRGRALAGVLLYGFFNFTLTFATIFWALQTLPAGPTQVVLALTPLLAFVFAVLHRLEKFRWSGIAGALFAIGGVTIVFMQQPPASVSVLAVFVVVVAAASYAEAAVLVKVFPRANPVSTNAVAMSLAAVVLLAISFFAGESHVLPTEARTITALVYLVVFGTVFLFLATIFVIRRWTASAAAYMLVFVPFVTVTIASLLADEPLTLTILLGIVVAALGVWVGAFARFGTNRSVHT
jgi:drug/metabolite transporter (DMT)-like permease